MDRNDRGTISPAWPRRVKRPAGRDGPTFLSHDGSDARARPSRDLLILPQIGPVPNQSPNYACFRAIAPVFFRVGSGRSDRSWANGVSSGNAIHHPSARRSRHGPHGSCAGARVPVPRMTLRATHQPDRSLPDRAVLAAVANGSAFPFGAASASGPGSRRPLMCGCFLADRNTLCVVHRIPQMQGDLS
jgi:hypothetical protein